jgi:hypothetical protein
LEEWKVQNVQFPRTHDKRMEPRDNSSLSKMQTTGNEELRL